MSDLTFRDVLDILRLIDTAPFSDLEVEFEGTRVKVTRRAAAAVGAMPGAAPIKAVARAAEPVTTHAARHGVSPRADVNNVFAADSPARRSAVEFPNRVDVKSPMAGTYYAAPSPGAAPFVEVDRAVKKGDQLGIIEVMKLFTPVRSPCDGIVRAILVANEQFVESEQTLMAIEVAE